MVDALTAHPAADRSTPQALIAEQDRYVVALTSALSDAASHADASGRLLQILTPAHSRITYPLELFLRAAGAQWVVRTGPEQFRDGLTGLALRYNGAQFVTNDTAPPPALEKVQPGSGDLEIQLSTPHPAADTQQLGHSTQIAMHTLTGTDPTGWGKTEPATQPWQPRKITTRCRERAPKPTSLVTVGNEIRGRLLVERTNTGTAEHVHLSGPAARLVTRDTVDQLAEQIATTAQRMLVSAHPARTDGLRTNRPGPPALPYAILIGHDTIAQRGLEHAQRVPANSFHILGSTDRPALWCRLDTGPDQPYEQLTKIARHFNIIQT